ncbi:MAG: hypothetical protein KA254_03410 [Rhodoferax sp.]|nr:hypothetical protein [Rhodoferax sp.]
MGASDPLVNGCIGNISIKLNGVAKSGTDLKVINCDVLNGTQLLIAMSPGSNGIGVVAPVIPAGTQVEIQVTGVTVPSTVNQAITYLHTTDNGGNPIDSPSSSVTVATPPNAAPTASAVAITGTAQVNVALSGGYTYADAESDAQGTSTFRWVRNTVNTGVGGGTDVATTLNYTAVAGDQGKYLYFCVTPVASAGTTTGTEVCSSATAAVAAANAAPTASAVATAGTAQVGVQLTGSYTYADAESNPQGTSTFRWVRNTITTGVGGGTNVATTQNYTAVAGDQGKYLYFCVIPVASAGTTTGTEVCSTATAAVAAAPVAAPAPPANPIPAVIPPPQVPGVGSNLLSPLNLSSGDGPAMTNCLRDALRTVIGPDAVYQGQTTDGGARIGQTALVVSFYALEASTSTNNPGINLRGSNPLSVLTSCGTFTTVPSVYNLGEWGAFLNGRGLSATFNAQGVMTVVVGGTTYVARPDYVVTQVTPGAHGLTTGSDGLMRFTDSAGNMQILYPAFIDPEVLVNQIAQAFGGTTLIQTDGTALVTLFNGQKFVLTPDMTLGTVPPEQFAASWWQDGPNHYRYRISSFSATSQGFTVKPL